MLTVKPHCSRDIYAFYFRFLDPWLWRKMEYRHATENYLPNLRRREVPWWWTFSHPLINLLELLGRLPERSNYLLTTIMLIWIVKLKYNFFSVLIWQEWVHIHSGLQCPLTTVQAWVPCLGYRQTLGCQSPCPCTQPPPSLPCLWACPPCRAWEPPPWPPREDQVQALVSPVCPQLRIPVLLHRIQASLWILYHHLYHLQCHLFYRKFISLVHSNATLSIELKESRINETVIIQINLLHSDDERLIQIDNFVVSSEIKQWKQT